MQWDLAAEAVSLLYLCIIWTYSRKGNPLPTRKNKVFQLCFLITFVAMLSNVASTLCIYNYQQVPLWLNWFVTTIYFVATPLMGLLYFVYASIIAYEQEDALPKYFWVYILPAAIYLIFVLINPWTKLLFDINLRSGYLQGPFILLTYVIFYVYCAACLLVTLLSRKLNRSTRQILMAFPVMACITVIIQQAFPRVLLSGSAATMTLLIIYLYLQNRQMSMDHLLSISNRQSFMDSMYMLMRSNADRPFYVLVFSLRDFKQVNEQFGQQIGDELLKAIAYYLQTEVRPHRVFRYGGDEFAVLVEDDRQEYAMRLAQRLYQGIATVWNVQQYRALISTVVGVVRYPDAARDVGSIIIGIEHSVTKAKLDKSSDFCIFTPCMLENTKRQREIAIILKDTYERDGFDVFFQPLWSIENQNYTVAESLLRMSNTPIGPIYPNEFIPMAESTGLIIGITYQVLHKVCQFIKRAHAEGVALDSVTVNFSTIQFTQPDVAPRVLEIIKGYAIPFSCVKIEITESAVVENPDELIRFVEEMNRNGIQVGMDDFGTGYCNLASVMTTPLDFVKIDKSLLWSAMVNRKSSIMMRSLIHIIHQFGIEVVCEGAETLDQANFCMAAGCEWIQGYYYCYPLCADDALCIMRGNTTTRGGYTPPSQQQADCHSI